jgi:hypothetical protein
LISPKGSSVYFVFVLINRLPFPPVTGTKYSNHIVSVRKAYREDTVTGHSKAVVAHFIIAVAHVFSDDTMRVGKGELGRCEWDPHAFVGFHDPFSNPIQSALLTCHYLIKNQSKKPYYNMAYNMVTICLSMFSKRHKRDRLFFGPDNFLVGTLFAMAILNALFCL